MICYYLWFYELLIKMLSMEMFSVGKYWINIMILAKKFLMLMNEIKYVQMFKKYWQSFSNNVMMIAGNLQIFLNSTKIYVMWSHNKDRIIHPWPINYAYFICINYQDCEKFTLSKYSSLNYSINISRFLLELMSFYFFKVISTPYESLNADI